MKPTFSQTKNVCASRVFFAALLSLFVLHGQLLLAQNFVHPGILNSRLELEFIKEKVKTNQQPWKQSFDALKSSGYASLAKKAKPFATVTCGSYNNPNIGCNEMVEDGAAAYSQALMWYLTEDKRYADNAIAIISAWTGKYEKNTESNSRLVVSWATPWYVNAAEILRYTNSGWTNTQNQSFTDLLVNKWLPYTLDESMPGNNWIQSAIEAHIAIAIFTDNRSLFDDAMTRWKYRVRTYIYQTTDGPFPVASPNKTTSQMASIWKNVSPGTDYIDGLNMETCRDMGHLMLGFKSMMYAGQYAWQQGVDLFAPEQKRITDFLELHNKWMSGAVKVPSNICGGKLYLNPGNAMPASGGGGQALEIAVNHYKTRLGKSLPATESMLLKRRPATANMWVSKWETLTHGDLPFLGTGILIKPWQQKQIAPHFSLKKTDKGENYFEEIIPTGKNGYRLNGSLFWTEHY